MTSPLVLDRRRHDFKLWDSLVLMAITIWSFSSLAWSQIEEASALTEIAKLKGRIKRDEQRFGSPVVYVSFTNTKVTDDKLKLLVQFDQLATLILISNKITDSGLVHLKKIKTLKFIDLTNTKITDKGLKSLGELTGLDTLTLSITQVSDAGLEHIKFLEKLRILELSFTGISDEGLKRIGKFRGLEYLILDGDNITDAGLEHLKGLTNLRLLGLQKTRVTDTGLKKLKLACPKLKILY